MITGMFGPSSLTPAKQFHAIEPRHAQIGNEHVIGLLFKHLPAPGSVQGDIGLDPIGAEIILERKGKLLFIVHNENAHLQSPRFFDIAVEFSKRRLILKHMNDSSVLSGNFHHRHTREAIAAGFLYPSSAPELSEKIDALLEDADIPADRSLAIVSPHGSLDYSGALAAKAWKSASGREVDIAIILSPSHRSFEPGIFLPEAHYFSVPNGQFKVDRPLLKALLHCTTSLRQSDIPHFEEHSIEMQLIYAARYFPRTLILPIVISGADDQALDSLFSNLQFLLGERIASTLFVLTTNLAVDEDADKCLETSAAFVQSVEKKEIDRVLTYCEGAPSFCGGRIIAAFLRSSLSSAVKPLILGLGSSVAFAEKGEPIVGYAAIGFSGE